VGERRFKHIGRREYDPSCRCRKTGCYYRRQGNGNNSGCGSNARMGNHGFEYFVERKLEFSRREIRRACKGWDGS
jgi:hypothetical protein